MNRKTLLVSVISLAVLGVVLGVAIFGERQKKSNEQGISPTSSAPAPTLSEQDRERVLKTPGENASDDEKQAYYEFIRSRAQSAQVLNVSGCAPAPLVYKVKTGGEFTLQNRDEKEHTIVFNPQNVYRIPGGGSVVAKADFEQGAGIYGYGCDGSPGVAGMVSTE